MVSGALLPIRKDDPRFLDLQKTLAQKKQQQVFSKRKMPDIKSVNAIEQGREMGRDVANLKGSQFVLIGEWHGSPSAMDGFLGVIQGLKDKMARPRQVILLRENNPKMSSVAKAFDTWNMGNSAKGTLGSMVAAPASVTQWQDDVWLARDEWSDYLNDIYLPSALNKASDMFPGLKAYGVDINDSGYSPFKKAYDENLADRDSAMVLRIEELQKTYPDAIFVGIFGNCHVPKQMVDSVQPVKDKNLYGMNFNDPMGEQLSLLHGSENVHAMSVMLENDALNVDSSDKIVKKNSGQFDMVVRVKRISNKKDWHSQWLTDR